MLLRYSYLGRRRRRTLPVWVIICILAGLLGYDQLGRVLQKREAWSGVVLRTYAERSLLGRHGRAFNRYWEVRTSDGTTKQVRIYSRDLWKQGAGGHSVTKRAGQLDPNLHG